MTPQELEAKYAELLTTTRLIDTRDHLPLFHSLQGSILEIGCDVGNSTTAFLSGASTRVTSIGINPVCAGNFPDVEKWRFVLGDSRMSDTYLQVSGEKFDALYVDGAHDYASALDDIRTYSALVRAGGLVLVHDVLAHDTFPGVFRAFSDFRFTMYEGSRITGKYILPGSYGLGVIEL